MVKGSSGVGSTVDDRARSTIASVVLGTNSSKLWVIEPSPTRVPVRVSIRVWAFGFYTKGLRYLCSM